MNQNMFELRKTLFGEGNELNLEAKENEGILGRTLNTLFLVIDKMGCKIKENKFGELELVGK